LAQVLKQLGSTRIWVTHGEGGLDEITPSGTTWVAELKDGAVTSFEITPEEAGITRSPLAALKGGDAAYNAAALSAVLAGERNGFRDAAVMTAAAALIVAGRADGLKAGAEAAAEAIDSGRAAAALKSLVAISNAPATG
jgi:anthranilate phosphoribosyltransferase